MYICVSCFVQKISLNWSTFCNHGDGDASSWGQVSCDLNSLRSRSQWGLIYNKNMTVSAIASDDSFATKLSLMVARWSYAEMSSGNIGFQCPRSRSCEKVDCCDLSQRLVIVQNWIECLSVLYFLYHWYLATELGA